MNNDNRNRPDYGSNTPIRNNSSVNRGGKYASGNTYGAGYGAERRQRPQGEPRPLSPQDAQRYQDTQRSSRADGRDPSEMRGGRPVREYPRDADRRYRAGNEREFMREHPAENTSNIRYQSAYEYTVSNMRRPRRRNTDRKPLGRRILSGILKTLAFILTFAAVLVATLFVCLRMMCTEDHPWIVQTFLETGQMKFIPSLFLSDDDIQKIVDSNAMGTLDEDIDNDLIKIGDSGSINLSAEEKAWGDIEVFEVKGSTYYGTMIYVKDPSRISVGSIYPWRAEGITLEQLVNDCGAIGGINGGLYNSYNNSGGAPYGVLVSNGEIQNNDPQGNVGFVLIGFTEDNILQIIDISKMTPDDIVNLVAEKHIRDAVTFQEENSDANNHFVQLIINGVTREMSGAGSGLNPRTAIGQRADGSILLLVTDGRGKNGHAGASALDLINIMVKYGAVNAANLDGGSSSCMYYNGEYLMDSVTFYYSNTSWKLPAGFMIK